MVNTGVPFLWSAFVVLQISHTEIQHTWIIWKYKRDNFYCKILQNKIEACVQTKTAEDIDPEL